MLNDLKSELESSGYKVNEIIPNILSVENFLSDDEIDGILDVINNASEDDWKQEYLNNLKPFCMQKFGRDDVENLVAEGKFEITVNWEDKNLDIAHLYPNIHDIYSRLQRIITKLTENKLQIGGMRTIQRMYDGVELKSHTDQHTDPSIRYATIIYLNDNYVNGELFFVNKDLDVRPKPGTLLVFPGNEEFEHGVKHVGKGPMRYVIVGFIKVSKFYENNRY